MNLILGPPLCPCANEGSWSVCVLGVMVLSPLPVTMPSASSLSPVLHHTWFFQALNLSWILWGWLVPGTCILLLLLRLLLPLPFFQIKKKNPPLFLLLLFFLSFWFYTFFILKWGVGRKKNLHVQYGVCLQRRWQYSGCTMIGYSLKLVTFETITLASALGAHRTSEISESETK